VVVTAGLDLTYDEYTVAPSDHIEFATGASPVAGENFITLARIPRRHEVFGVSGASGVGAR
jgi:hypothetical protein